MCDIVGLVIVLHSIAYGVFGVWGSFMVKKYYDLTDFVPVVTIFFIVCLIVSVFVTCCTTGVGFESTHYLTFVYQLSVVIMLIWCVVVKWYATAEMKQHNDFMVFMSSTLTFLFASFIINLAALETTAKIESRRNYGAYY